MLQIILARYWICPSTIQGLHFLGHTFATLALNNGVDVKTVSSMRGHYSAGFTLDAYMHVTSEMQRSATEKMSSFMDGAMPMDLP